MGYEQNTWCDVCGKRKTDKGFPRNFYTVGINQGYPASEIILSGHYCSAECVLSALRAVMDLLEKRAKGELSVPRPILCLVDKPPDAHPQEGT